MAAAFYAKDAGGTWRLIKAIYAKDSGGVWRAIKEAWAKDAGGTWRKVFTSFTVAATFTAGDTTEGAASSVNFNPDGTITTSSGNSGSWGSPATAGIGASYYVKLHRNSGATIGQGGVTLDTWYQLNVTRSITMALPGTGARTANYTYYISSSASDAGIISSNSFTQTSTQA